MGKIKSDKAPQRRSQRTAKTPSRFRPGHANVPNEVRGELLISGSSLAIARIT
jgi:hypothetical protein